MVVTVNSDLNNQDINELNLVWVDMEMSGLDPEHDRILEVAMIVTDSSLEIIAEAEFVIYQPPEILDNMDKWNTRQHGSSGLIQEVNNSLLSEEEVEQQLMEFLQKYVQACKAPMCGNSVHQDRRFMQRYMPELEKFFHYRNIDVSSLKELARRWNPDLLPPRPKYSNHRAKSDIYDSIAELRNYKMNLFTPGSVFS